MWVRTPLWSIFLILNLCSNTQGSTLLMSFKENEEPGSLVANLYQIFGVESSLKHSRYFQILGQRLMIGDTIVEEDGKWVSLNSDNGQLEVDVPIDRERECGDEDTLDCVINVEVAMLPNKYFRIMHFDFLVSDDNDHAPKFPEFQTGEIFSVNVAEDVPIDSTISLDHIMATDADSGINAEIYYTLTSNDFFGIKQYDDTIGTSHLDLVVIKEPDYEVQRAIELVLTARDSGDPPRSSRIILKINIVDANDHSPIFQQKEYKLTLKENLKANTLIDTLLAQDSDHGALGKVEYFVPRKGNTKEARELITINPDNGEVRLKKELDREKHNGVRIVIGAKDGANASQGGAKVGKTILTISVEDINDNDPEIHVNIVLKGPNRKQAYVPENANKGLFIAHIIATDKDTEANGQVALKMKTYPIDKAFELTDNNLVKISSSLDREIINKYILELQACDNGKRPRCSIKNVTAEIVDINDHAPIFRPMKNNFVVPENKEIGTLLTHVIADDKDLVNQPSLRQVDKEMFMPSSNGVVRYSMTGGKSEFEIESTSGKITLVGTLDYELTDEYTLLVTARDLGSPRRNNQTVIKVRILDVNDHRPEFSNPAIDNSSIVATILDDGAIATIKASDRDTGNNAQVKYSLVQENGKPDNSAVFILDKYSGDIRFNGSNNLREVIGDHRILIQATDNGRPPLSSTTALYIRVTDLALSEIREIHPLGGSIDPTVIILASLAAATVILLIILAVIVLKCRKENKEIRTYNCRDEESKKGWLSKSTSHPRHSSIDEVVVVNSPSDVTSTKDVNFMRSMEIGRRNTLKSNCSTSHSVVVREMIHDDDRFSALSCPRNYDEYKRDVQVKTQTDGDSGKGESDRDSLSAGDKEKMPISTSQYEPMTMQYLNKLGPRCTDTCRMYGHSDTCWMNVSATTLNERPSRVSSPRNVDLGYALHPIIPNTSYNDGSNFENYNLESIEETQPLRCMFNTTGHPPQQLYEYPPYPRYDNQTYEDQYYPEMSVQDNRYSVDFDTHTIPRSALPPHEGYFTPSHHSPSQHNSPSPSTSTSTLKPSNSNMVSPQPSDMHSRPQSRRNSRAEPETISVGDKIKMFSKPVPPANIQRRPSAASMRENLLHKRHLKNNTSFSSTHSTSDNTSRAPTNEYSGETSMEETQEILSDIDQLITQ